MAKKATVVLLILVLLLGVLGAIYHLYISNRESSFIDRNFRLLALWSHELSNKVDQYKYDFQYRSSVALSKEDKSAECGKPDSQETNPVPQCPENVFPEDPNKKCDCSKNPDDKFKKAFKKEFETLSENYEGQFTLVSVSRKDKTLNSNNAQVVDKRPHITVQLSSKDEASLRLKYSEKRTKCPTVCKDNAFEIINVQADLSISKIISPLIAEQAFDDVFDNIIVFNSKTGKVHFQKDHFLFGIDNIYDIIVQRSDADGFFSVFSGNSASADTRNNEPDSSTRHSLEALLQNPTHRHIAIGESSYEFFTQPVVLPGLSLKKQTKYKQTNDVPTRLILAGFVKTEKFESEYRAIPHTWLVFLLFLVLLGFLSLSIFHLGLMDTREPLNFRARLSLLVACVFGTAIITLLFLDTVWFNNVRYNLDDQLEETAGTIKETFGIELENTLRLLHESDCSNEFAEDFKWVTQKNDAHACDAENACKRDCPDNAATKKKFERSDNSCNCVSGGTSDKDKWRARKNLRKSNKTSGEFYDLFFWVDPDKRFRITWTTQEKYYLTTSNVSLAHRDYVKRILDPAPESSLWHITIEGQRPPVPFYAQNVRSLQTGKHKVIVSMESSQSQRSSEGKPEKWVAAVRTDFKFLKSVAIPHGTGFAVIEDEGGKVLFHSDENRNLWENFIEETDNNAQLTANVFSRTPGKFGGTYWGKGHAFYSTPLPDVPWSLVVFRNKELFRTTNFEALLLASALFAVYLVIVSIVLAVTYMMIAAVRCLCNKATGPVPLRKTFMFWFWPDSGRLGWDYIVIGLMAGIFFLAGIILFAYGIVPGDSAVWVVFPYLLFSGMLIWMTTKCCDKRAPKPSAEIPPEQLQQLLHCRYTFAVISLLLLFSALPMATFFKIGTDREMLLAMKYNLITLGHKLRWAPDLDFSQIRATGNCTENGSSEACLQRGIHLNVFANTELVVSGDRPEDKDPHPSILDKFHRFIRENSLSRLSNHVSIETLGLLRKQPPDKADEADKPDKTFYWEDVSSSSISLTFQAPIKQSGSPPNWVTLKASPFPDTWFSIKDSLDIKDFPDIRDSSDIKGFPDKRHVVSLIVFIAGVLVIVLVPLFIVRRIFPILPEPSINENHNRDTENFLIVGPSHTLNAVILQHFVNRWECIDGRLISDSLEWRAIRGRVLEQENFGVLFRNFEYKFGVPQFDRAKRELLAALLSQGKPICVLSAINPLELAPENEPAPSSPGKSKDEWKIPAPVSLKQWSQVFQSFTLRYQQEALPDSDSENPHANEPSYEAIWQALPPGQKITLHNLAKDGFVHAENPDLVVLSQRGLINAQPQPIAGWLDGNFENYILRAAKREGLDTKEQKSQSQWQVWKVPLVVVFIVLALGLLLTQEEFSNVVVLMLSALPVLLPTLSELIGSPQTGGKAGSNG